MKVLVGITTHNRADILAKSIQSALDQDYENKQIAVFDDASTDETKELRKKFPNVTWYRSEKTVGYLHARNQLMRETDADLFISLDDDAWFIKGDEVSIGVQTMRERPHVAALAYDILSPDRPNIKARSGPRTTHTFIGCGHLLRLSKIKEIGFYIPNPGFYGGEEQDLSIRLLDHGCELLILPGVHVWHEKTLQARDLTKQHLSAVCNDLAFAVRRSPASSLFWLLPGKILSHTRFALMNNYLLPCLKGFYMFFSALPRLFSTREAVSKAAFHEYRRRMRLMV